MRFEAADLNAVVRLLGRMADPQARPLGEALQARRAELFNGLAALIDATAWGWVHGRRDPAGERIMVFHTLDCFQSDEQEQAIRRSTLDDEIRQLVDQPLNRLLDTRAGESPGRAHFTRTRADLIDQCRWHNSATYREHRRPVGLDDFLYSIYPLSEDTWSGTAFFRSVGQTPFGDRERAMVHLVLNNVDWLHRAESDVPANNDALTELPPRSRQVLLRLMAGDSAKQVATRLHMSIHTVHDHIKGIYDHFGVSSRAELLARFISTSAEVKKPQN